MLIRERHKQLFEVERKVRHYLQYNGPEFHRKMAGDPEKFAKLVESAVEAIVSEAKMKSQIMHMAMLSWPWAAHEIKIRGIHMMMRVRDDWS